MGTSWKVDERVENKAIRRSFREMEEGKISDSRLSVRYQFSLCQKKFSGTQYIGDDISLPPVIGSANLKTSSQSARPYVIRRLGSELETFSEFCLGPISEFVFRSIEGRLLGSVPGVMTEKVGFVFLSDLSTTQIYFFKRNTELSEPSK